MSLITHLKTFLPTTQCCLCPFGGSVLSCNTQLVDFSDKVLLVMFNRQLEPEHWKNGRVTVESLFSGIEVSL